MCRERKWSCECYERLLGARLSELQKGMFAESGVNPPYSREDDYRNAASAAPLELLRIEVAEAEQRVFVVRARSFADYVRSG